MTDALSGDRRSFLAAGAATIVAVSVAAPAIAHAAIPRAQWDTAMARYKAARIAYDRHSLEIHDPASAQGKMTSEIGDENDRLGEILYDCENALIHAPAPDRRALRWKLDYLLKGASDGHADGWSRDYTAQTLADIARLLGDA